MAADRPIPDPSQASGVNPQGAQADPDAGEAQGAPAEKQFHGWRLLGVLFLVVVATGIVSAVVDLVVIPR